MSDNLESLLDTTDPPSDDIIGRIIGLSHVVVDQLGEIFLEPAAPHVEKDALPLSEHVAMERRGRG